MRSLALLLAFSIPSMMAMDLDDAWRSRNDWTIAHAVAAAHKAGTLDLAVPKAMSWGRSARAVRHAVPWLTRQQWHQVASDIGAPSPIDPQAMDTLTSARANTIAEEQARLFGQAWDQGAAFTEQDHVDWGLALLAAGRSDEGRDRLLMISDDKRSKLGLRQKLAELGAPSARPKVLFHSLLGGSGDQRISKITTFPDGRVQFAGKGFSATVFVDGLDSYVEGDIGTGDKPSGGSGWLPIEWNTNEKNMQILKDPGRDQQYKWRSVQVHPVLQQPFVESSSGWKLWGWSYSECEKAGLMADSRIFRLWLRPDGMLGALTWTDGGNTVLAKNPQNLKRGGIRGFGKGARMCAIILDPDNDGAIVNAKVIPGTVPPHWADPWGRLWLGGLFRSRAGFAFIDDKLNAKPGGALGASDVKGVKAGFSVMRQAGPYLFLGGSTNAPRIPGRKAIQDKSGGGHDALMAIIKLW